MKNALKESKQMDEYNISTILQFWLNIFERNKKPIKNKYYTIAFFFPISDHMIS